MSTKWKVKDIERLQKKGMVNEVVPVKKARFIIGIDTGTKTGLAIWDRQLKVFVEIGTYDIHIAMAAVEKWHRDHDIKVRFEDARQRIWLGKKGEEAKQGAGSIKRDCKIWEDFLTYLGVDFDMVPPKNVWTKMNSETFLKLTGWNKRTSNHARDAAMLVYGIY